MESAGNSVVGIEGFKHKSYFLLPVQTLIGSDAGADCNFSLERLTLKRKLGAGTTYDINLPVTSVSGQIGFRDAVAGGHSNGLL